MSGRHTPMAKIAACGLKEKHKKQLPVSILFWAPCANYIVI